MFWVFWALQGLQGLQALQALQALIANVSRARFNIIHADLKPDNILISQAARLHKAVASYIRLRFWVT